MPIHQYERDGAYIVVDPASGAVHLADKEAFDLLETLTPPLTADYPDKSGCYAELLDLYEKGLLFSEDGAQQYAETAADAPLKALCLHVSHDCNLRCGYCFAETGGYGRERGVMPIETAVKAIDFLVANSGGRTELEADFFGGEPLMAWDTVTGAVNYARANEKAWNKRFRFTVTTNGLLLDDEKTAFINREMSNVVLSLDGRREVNDRIRVAPNGKGSYGAIVPRFQKLIQTRTEPGFTDYYVRGTFTAHNLDFAEDVKEMARLGFKNVSVEPVTADGDNDNAAYAIKKEHIPRICEEYDKLYGLIKNKELDVNFFHFNIDLKQGPCVIRRLRACGCGNEYLAVTPEGGVYPCHRFVGIDGFNMGNINGGGLDMNIKDYFAKTHIYSKSDCVSCWARFYCGGGCNATNQAGYGDARKSRADSAACLLMKKRLECAIALAAVGR